MKGPIVRQLYSTAHRVAQLTHPQIRRKLFNFGCPWRPVDVTVEDSGMVLSTVVPSY